MTSKPGRTAGSDRSEREAGLGARALNVICFQMALAPNCYHDALMCNISSYCGSRYALNK